MSVQITGVTVHNNNKERGYKKEISDLRQEVFDLKCRLAEKMQEIEWLVEKIHKMGGRIKK